MSKPQEPKRYAIEVYCGCGEDWCRQKELDTNGLFMLAEEALAYAAAVHQEALDEAADKMKYLKQFHAHNAKVLDNDKVYNRTAAFIYGDAEKAIRKLKEGK